MQTKAKRYGRQPINGRQIKTIHAITNKLGMHDDEYRTLLYGMFEVLSSKDLSWAEAEDLISDLNRKSGSRNEDRGTRTDKSSDTKHRSSNLNRRYADLDGRPGMATAAQCRMIAGMWADVSRMEDAESREKALRGFLYRIVGVDHFRFLKRWQVEKVVRAMEAMGAVAPGRDRERRDV
jgi:phage gp16-like protein